MKREPIQRFLQLSRNYPVFDVRSPAEYEKGHIPGAFSLPIVDDAQRAEVGTLYVQASPRDAYLRGLELIGPRLHEFARTALEHSVEGKVLLYCWRGGMRSNSMAWLFELVGLKPVVLEGGYKSFREHIRQSFERKLDYIVLGGYTGAGKTALLHRLAQAGEQVLDLEGLARHKGSVFGAIGMGEQPHYESFEISLYEQLSGMDPGRPVYVEHENREIGRLLLPPALYSRISAAPLILIERSMDHRLGRLAQDYLSVDKAILKGYVSRIGKRLGGERTRQALLDIDEGNMTEAIRAVLHYYDKAYQRSLDRNNNIRAVIKSDVDEDLIQKILHLSKERTL